MKTVLYYTMLVTISVSISLGVATALGWPGWFPWLGAFIGISIGFVGAHFAPEWRQR